MNVLRVMFDSKLTWANHVANQIYKTARAFHAIKLIRSLQYMQIIMNVIVKSLNSFIYIFLLLLLFMYIYALLVS